MCSKQYPELLARVGLIHDTLAVNIAIEIRRRVMFIFYLGLPHMCLRHPAFRAIATRFEVHGGLVHIKVREARTLGGSGHIYAWNC